MNESSQPPTNVSSQRLSRPIEWLLQSGRPRVCDVLIVGSGYGGALAALELAGAGRSVWVLERGKEFALGEFPETLGELPGEVQFSRDDDKKPRGRPDALFDVRIDKDVSALVGCGLGGTSLINAGVAIAPIASVLDDPRWPPELIADRGELQRCFDDVRQLIGAAPYPKAQALAKFQALERLARSLDAGACEPAAIAVTSRDGPNVVGVRQAACIDCGNCVTGCNVGAKNTLAMNAIPLAISRGAEFFTGAQALEIVPARGTRYSANHRSARWTVRVARTSTLRDREGADVFEISASTLILAAGTLGSTELLLRSRPALALSSVLGQRFSTNGDAIAFGYGQAHRVDALAHVEPDASQATRYRRVGPTITGQVRGRDGSPLPAAAVVEDGAIPWALTSLIGPMLTTLALPHRYTSAEPPAWHQTNTDRDPIAVVPDAARHHQVLLAMNLDSGDGELSLRLAGDDDASGTGARTPTRHADWKLSMSAAAPGVRRAQQQVHEAFKHAQKHRQLDGRGGFDGGYYVTNPIWKLLPDGSADAAGDLESRVLTVHPLGGCVMGADARCGVVDHLGRVYDTTTPTSVHAGLHVLDGAIVPVALGVNPLLTIGALSLRAARRIAAQMGQPAASTHCAVDPARVVPPLRRRREPPAPARDHRITFTEVLHTPQPGTQRALPTQWAALLSSEEFARLCNGEAGLALKVTTTVGLWDWLEKPYTPWRGTVELGVYDFDKGRGFPQSTGFWPDVPGEGPVPALDPECGDVVHNAGQCPPPLPHGHATVGYTLNQDLGTAKLRVFARGSACVTIFAEDRPLDHDQLQDRIGAAMSAYSKRRGLISSLRRESGPPGPRQEACAPGFIADPDPPPRETNAWQRANYFHRAAESHAIWRTLDYDLDLTAVPTAAAQDVAARTIRITGSKRLAYDNKHKNVWNALLELDATARVGDAPPVALPLKVDVVDLLSRGVYQLSGAADTPTAISGLFGVATGWVRALMSTNYWWFAGREYGVQIPRFSGGQPLSSLRLRGGVTIPPKEYFFKVKRGEGREGLRLPLRLSRYRRSESAPRGPLLMIHGLAHGGEVFTTDTVDVCMAAYFVDLGYDVWVLDNRMSNRLGWVSRQRASIDDIAAFDIPQALRRVRRHTGNLPVNVFAHCVGAAATSMAILGGKIDKCCGPNAIASLVLHAVTPWIAPSKWNRVSAGLAAFYKDFLGDDEVIDPILPWQSKAKDQIIDRLASSIPWDDERTGGQPSERTLHRADDGECECGTAICNRMTLFYGREWRHANLDPRTHARLHELVGPAHVEIFKHIFSIALRQRLTDKDGANIYVREDAFIRFWKFPTMFACGEENQVFDPRSAAKSYLRLKQIRDAADASAGLQPRNDNVVLFLPPAIGHMDFLFGRNAHRERDAEAPGSGVYPVLERFFAKKLQATELVDRPTALARAPDIEAKTSPLTGPSFTAGLSGRDLIIDAALEFRPYAVGAWRIRTPNETPLLKVTPTPLAAPRGPASANTDPADYRDSAEQHWSVRWEYRNLTNAAAVPLPEVIGTGPIWESVGLNAIIQSVNLTSVLNALSVEGGNAAASAPARRTPQAAPEVTRADGTTDYAIQIETADRWWFTNLLNILRNPHVRTASFLLGSCRWPGMAGDQRAIDAFIGRMLEMARATENGIDGLWLLGDQIYADAVADVFDTAESGERAANRYRQAFAADRRYDELFQSTAMAELLRRVPTWMVVDDHEFRDDWPGQPVTGSLPRELDFERRFHAAVAYQWRRYGVPEQDMPRMAGGRVVRGFWHPFNCAGLQCFALDTRTERQLRRHGDWHERRIMSDAQFDAFAQWLRDHGNSPEPKFVLCGSPFGLLREREQREPAAAMDADDWAAYPASLRRLAELLITVRPRNLVFVSGDPHLSLRSTIDLWPAGAPADASPVVVHSVVSSGLNATLPFANGRRDDYVSGDLPMLKGAPRVKVAVEVLCTDQRQFGRLDARRPAQDAPWTVDYTVYREDGTHAAQCKLF